MPLAENQATLVCCGHDMNQVSSELHRLVAEYRNARVITLTSSTNWWSGFRSSIRVLAIIEHDGPVGST